MSILKLKKVLATTIMGLATISAPAFAQVTTDDRDAQGLLEQIRDTNREDRDYNKDIRNEARKFRDDHIEKHYEEQIKHHERQLKRLNAMIDSFGYWKIDGDKLKDDPKIEGEAKKDAFDILADSTKARDAVHAAGEGKSPEFGIIFDGFNKDGLGGTNFGASYPAKFRKALGLQAPSEIYGNDSGSHGENLTRLYSSLYMASTVANEAHNGRKERLKVYSDLLTKAKATDDLQTELRVQNAILLENGRNLALLIDLQTAQLNAETAQLASLARSKNVPESMFGASTDLGADVFEGLVSSLNEGYKDIN